MLEGRFKSEKFLNDLVGICCILLNVLLIEFYEIICIRCSRKGKYFPGWCLKTAQGLPRWFSAKEPALQRKGQWFNPWSQKIRICHRAIKPVGHSYWAHSPLSPCSETGQATAASSQHTATKRVAPALPQLGKSQLSNEGPAQTKINLFFLNKGFPI